MPRPDSPPSPIRVLLVDDHGVVRVGLKTILADDPGIVVVGEASTGATGLDAAARLLPDVVILDLRLPDRPGCEICRALKQQADPPRVLVLTSFADDELIRQAMMAGADGYLLKDLEQIGIANAVRRVNEGQSVLAPDVLRRLLHSDPKRPEPEKAKRDDLLGRLTAQEKRLLALVATGVSSKEAARELKLGEGTVRNYLTSIFSKLEVQNRTEAAALWFRLTNLPPEE